MDVIDKTDDEPLLVSPEAIVEHLGAMDLSSSGLLEIVDAHGERQARAIKRTAREIAWNIVLPAESTNRAAAEQAALAAILALKKEHQILKVRTILGPKDIPAPADFAFDTTGTIVWIKLVNLAPEANFTIKVHRARYVLEKLGRASCREQVGTYE